jgi:hypothetical protein
MALVAETVDLMPAGWSEARLGAVAGGKMEVAASIQLATVRGLSHVLGKRAVT